MFCRFLNTRHLEPELMDQPDVDPTLHRQALAALESVNRLSRTASVLWRALLRWVPADRLPHLRLLDVACGGGDVLVQLGTWARARGWSWFLAGCDFSPRALEMSRIRARQAQLKLELFRHDVTQSSLPGGWDAVTCTLFLHHLEDQMAQQLLGQMAHAARHVALVDDLNRTCLGYVMAWTVGRLSRNLLVREDAPQSVRAAFTPAEVTRMAQAAGARVLELRRHWPQRWLLSFVAAEEEPALKEQAV